MTANTICPETEARAWAAKVAWYGHQSGRDVPAATVAGALALGLVREVPRLGGYVATKAGNAVEFGSEFAEAMAR